MASVARRAGWRLTLTAWVLGLLVSAASGQENFRITYKVDKSDSDRTKVSGFVFNDARVDVLDVYITAEAVDGAGKVVARGITFVSPMIRQGANAPFDASIPAPATATAFRVRVTGFRLGLGYQAP